MPENKHLGFKGTAKFIGWLIGAVVIIFEFLMNWIPAETVTPAMVVKVLVIAAVSAVGVPALFYIGDLLWSLADKVKEAIFGTE